VCENDARITITDFALRYAVTPLPSDALKQDLDRAIAGDVRFDAVSRALYSTDASVYQIEAGRHRHPRTRDDMVRAVEIARAHGVSITARARTSQAARRIGAGLQLDTSKYLNRILEVNAAGDGRGRAGVCSTS